MWYRNPLTGALSWLATAALATVGFLVPTGLTAAPAAAATDGTATFTGHGYGHGRGLGQYGSYGYAVDQGWGYQQILDHYYGGTSLAGDGGNGALTVDLLWMRARTPVFTGTGLAVDGTPTGAAAIRVERVAVNSFALYSGPGCNGPWTAWGGRWFAGGLQVSTSGSQADPANHVRVCDATQLRGYRGTIRVVEAYGSSATVNLVTLDDYLRGVVPRESPAGWGSAGGGRGMNALKAQAVAARSYALASNFAPHAKTCDTTQCQVYGGSLTQAPGAPFALLEDARTDQAVRETSGQIRRSAIGAVALTEFSSSTGGWTAGGRFPAVPDAGDATRINPNHDWTVEMDLGSVAQKLGTGTITGIRVTQRNGLGAEGGRALQVAVDTTSGVRTFTADAVRSRLGLKSTWFSVSTVSTAAAKSFVTASYHDFLGRAPDQGGLDGWTQAIVNGAGQDTVARSIALSPEGLGRRVDAVYASALHRAADPGGRQGWVAFLGAGASYIQFMGAVYGSEEAFNVLGHGSTEAWVDGMYREVLGRPAEPAGVTYWSSIARARGRGYVVEQISVSAEARQRRLAGYYQQLLQRDPDPAGRQWADRLFDRGDLQVPVDLASGAEYWQKAQQRFPQ